MFLNVYSLYQLGMQIKPKITAKRFLNLWKEGGDQEYYTALMMDILRQFEKLQKSMTTLGDIETTQKALLKGGCRGGQGRPWDFFDAVNLISFCYLKLHVKRF